MDANDYSSGGTSPSRESGKASLRALEELASPIGTFIRQRVQRRVGAEISHGALFVEWKSWCMQNNVLQPGTVQQFGRDLRAALPWITNVDRRVK